MLVRVRDEQNTTGVSKTVIIVPLQMFASPPPPQKKMHRLFEVILRISRQPPRAHSGSSTVIFCSLVEVHVTEGSS
jgi:hypothetical protein